MKNFIILFLILSFTNLYSTDDNLVYKIDKVSEKTHQFAGYTILGLVASNIYLGLENEKQYDRDNQELHENIGNILIWTAISSAMVGAYAHRDDLLDFSEGITKKHIHAMLGLVAVSFMAANLSYDLDEHKNGGILAGGFAITAFTVTLF